MTTPSLQKETASLRDQFAMAALTGLVAQYSTLAHNVSARAAMAYALADAMLAERARSTGEGAAQ